MKKINTILLNSIQNVSFATTLTDNMSASVDEDHTKSYSNYKHKSLFVHSFATPEKRVISVTPNRKVELYKGYPDILHQICQFWYLNLSVHIISYISKKWDGSDIFLDTPAFLGNRYQGDIDGWGPMQEKVLSVCQFGWKFL